MSTRSIGLCLYDMQQRFTVGLHDHLILGHACNDTPAQMFLECRHDREYLHQQHPLSCDAPASFPDQRKQTIEAIMLLIDLALMTEGRVISKPCWPRTAHVAFLSSFRSQALASKHGSVRKALDKGRAELHCVSEQVGYGMSRCM